MIEGKTRPISDLRRRLKRTIPTVDGHGLQQSRRIEGQLSRDREGHHFTSIRFLIQAGAARFEEAISKAVLAVIQAQWDDHHERFRYEFKPFGLTGKESAYTTEMVHAPRQAKKLARRLVESAGATAGESPAIIEDAGKSDPNGLLIILCVDHDVSLSKRAMDRIGRKDPKRVVCVLLDQEGFTQGLPSSELVTPTQAQKETSMNAPIDSSNVTVIGYSERGLVNALVQHIRDDHGKVKQFLKNIKWMKPENQESVESESKMKIDSLELKSVQWIVEPGFSQFGDPDIILLAWPSGSSRPWVFFIEAKVVDYSTSAMSNKEGMTKSGFNSSINGQLSLKYRLARALAAWGNAPQNERALRIQEPETLHRAATSLNEDPTCPPRQLCKKGNVRLFGSRLCPEPTVPDAYMETCFFIALTMDDEPPDDLFGSNDDDRKPLYFPSEPMGYAELARKQTGWCGWQCLFHEDRLELQKNPEFKIVYEPVLQTWNQHRNQRRSVGPSGSSIRTVLWKSLNDPDFESRAKALAKRICSISRKFKENSWATEVQQKGSWSILVGGRVAMKIVPRKTKTGNHLMVAAGSGIEATIPSFFSGEDVDINGQPFRPAVVQLTPSPADEELMTAIEEYFEGMSEAR